MLLHENGRSWKSQQYRRLLSWSKWLSNCASIGPLLEQISSTLVKKCNLTSLDKYQLRMKAVFIEKRDRKMTIWGFQGKHAHIYFIFAWRYSVKLGQKFAVFTYTGGMKTWKPMVVFIETGGFWRCQRPLAFNIAKTPSFNETIIDFKISTTRTRETTNFRPSFTETVIQKKNERFPFKTKT